MNQTFEEKYSALFAKQPVKVQYFGKTTKAFSKERLDIILNLERSKQSYNFDISKEYLMTYFVKSSRSPNVVYFYEVNGKDSVEISNDGLDVLKTVKYDIHYTIQGYEGDDGKRKFNPFEWFMRHAPGYFRMTSDPMKELFFDDECTGQSYINLSKGFLHKKRVPFQSFPDNIKRNVHRILDHLRKVWCSNDDVQYQYVLNWLSCALTGSKRHTALFLKSGEGTGKSIVVEFFINHVIGQALGLITSRAQQLLGFNSMLLEKILVCLEELPSGSKNEWHSLSDILKDIITGGKLTIEKKYEDMIQIVNYISLIIITNNDNTIKFGKDVRRYFMADISHDYIGNTEYFNALADACSCLKTGEAMFMYMCEHYEIIKGTFQENIIPETLAKQEMKERNTSEILSFVKRYYIKRGKGIYDKEHKTGQLMMNTLRKQFNDVSRTSMTAKAFAQNLRQDIPILKLTNYGKNKDLCIKITTFDELKKFFVSKGFWNDVFDKVECEIENKDEIETMQHKQDIKQIKVNQSSNKQRLDKLSAQLDEVMSLELIDEPIQQESEPIADKFKKILDNSKKSVFIKKTKSI